VRVTRATHVISSVISSVIREAIQGISETCETRETRGIPDTHRTTLRTQGMLTLARLPLRPRCLAASATPSLAHNSKGSQTRSLSDPTIGALTNLCSPYGSAPQYDQYGSTRRKYR
jgi:hypothetical protein